MTETSGKTILIVEDNPINQRLVVHTLQRRGYQCDVANNGQEGVLAVQQKPYAMILMDIQMPIMDGFEATAAIRKTEGPSRRIPIVAMTAHALTGDRDRCLANDMDDYIAKPFKPDDLQDMIERWIHVLDTSSQESKTVVDETSGEEKEQSIDYEVLDGLKELVMEEEDYYELIDLFLFDVPQQLQALYEAMDKQDGIVLGRTAHTLKGTCGTLGAVRMARLSRDLEAIGHAHTIRSAEPLIRELEHEFGKVRSALTLQKAS